MKVIEKILRNTGEFKKKDIPISAKFVTDFCTIATKCGEVMSKIKFSSLLKKPSG